MRKRVLFIANSLENAFKFRQVLQELDVGVVTGTSAQAGKLLVPGSNLDLVIFEATSSPSTYLDTIVSLAESEGCPLLVIVDEEGIARLNPLSRIPFDFVMSGAALRECLARTRRLLGLAASRPREEEIAVDEMTINLATYQVEISGEPVDFTYLEYALLAYLVQHPDRVFTREVLLQNVWGVDYYGGSRTVDVHVRRIRAKLGPALAQHLETVRSVGYLWHGEA